MAEPIVVNVIPGVGWVVKLLEDWTNRLKEHDLIYADLTDEAFWVSAAEAGDSIDKGRDSVEAGQCFDSEFRT